MFKPGPVIHFKVRSARVLAALVAASLVFTSLPSQALAPVILLLGRQMLQDMVTSTAKGMLLDSLSGMGCKGIALSNALTSLDGIKRGATVMPRGLPAGMTAMPTLPTGMPTLPTGMPGMPGMVGMPGMQGMAGIPPEMAAKMMSMMPGGVMPGGLDPEQSEMMAKMMGGMSTPLAPLETIATIDEMSDIGMLPKAMNAELKECMVLLPQAAQTMGMAFGMLKPMLPQLREARDQMHALSPADQDELAASLAQEFDKVPAAERKTLLTEIGGGMFPPRVVDSLTKRYGSK